MEPNTITHARNRSELVMLRAALGKYAGKVNAAITALRAAGQDAIADRQRDDLLPLVDLADDRGATTLERLDKEIGALKTDSTATITLTSTQAEAHAYEVGLPMVARRLRTLEGEMRSLGREDVGEWCVLTANYVDGELKDQQLPLKQESEAETVAASQMMIVS